jgi:hypothetical protein
MSTSSSHRTLRAVHVVCTLPPPPLSLGLLTEAGLPCQLPSHADMAPAGEPMNSDKTFCPVNQTSCYHYSSSTSTYAAAVTSCQAKGGHVVAWNTMAEQFEVGSCC